MVKISDWAPYGSGALFGFDHGTFCIDYRGQWPHPSLVSPVEIAAELYKSLSGPSTILVSGGVDSQASAYAAKMSGIDCRFVSFRYPDGLNDYDLPGAFYADNGIDVEILDFDIIEFHNTELIEWGHRYRSSSPHLISHMKMASLIPEGRVVFSGDAGLETTSSLNYQTIALERYAEVHPRVVGYFLNSSPHLFHAFSKVAERCTTSNDYDRKVDVYRAGGFPVIAQQQKLHGFEKLKEFYDRYPVTLTQKLKYKHRPSTRPYDIFFRYPLSQYELFKTSLHLY